MDHDQQKDDDEGGSALSVEQSVLLEEASMWKSIVNDGVNGVDVECLHFADWSMEHIAH